MFDRLIGNKRRTRVDTRTSQRAETMSKAQEAAIEAAKPALTAQDLDVLYATSNIKSLDLARFQKAGTKPVILMKALERQHAEPMPSINKSWFIYEFPNRTRTVRDVNSPYNLNGFVPFSYRFPLPVEAYEKLANLEAYLTNSHSYCRVFITAPSPYLGNMIDEEPEPKPVVRIYPILVVRVTFEHKLYYYNLCTWNLQEDMKFAPKEE
jgi:hypothetical protein